ncbi:PREDICTED: uncharacterized protein LOC100637319 [Amphimedon queenslandica]|uniref:Succinate-semialdehyde dehydrogenase n=1 Tax=Amphimedon queenslandica TaxID=400682 RepID=A0A1X7VRW3_AMPQE|nr:PREDICTED: uncharacterized protein LOC100637319 [Amphimedon queenslandica]|eukprot:XP_011406152.1 PREDICTED: uncharacterized protein LOC100637319 [Amphimedon queenslandica]
MATKLVNFLGKGVPQGARSPFFKNRGWINGQWVEAKEKRYFPVTNPANTELITEVPDMQREDVLEAIESSYAAQKLWRRQTAKSRALLLRQWYELMNKHKSEIAKMITIEQGKPYTESLNEVNYGMSFIDWFSEEGKRLYGDVLPSPQENKRMFLMKEPVGVAALITPWNFPLAMITRKAGAALAAGCSIIIKPSEETPLTALAIAQLSHEAGIPPGVINVLTCSRDSVHEVSDVLLDDERISKISFTGSTAIGKRLIAGSANTVKKLSLELGGNAPFIVFDTADVDVAVKGAIAGKFRNAGQTCVSPNRLLVQSKIYNEFVDKLTQAVSNLKVGDGLNDGIDQGPLINAGAIDKVERHVNDAVDQGGEVLVGGTRMTSLPGTFYNPSVLINVNNEMLITREETFGPIAPIIKFDTEDEAVSIANNTQFGLIGYFYSRDIDQIWRVSDALETGMVGINEALLSNEVGAFGGKKQSGFGREGSKYGINEYINIKYVCMGNLKT